VRLLIAIPVFNERKYVEAVLDKVKRFHPDILVIDDGSRDNSAELAARYPEVRLIRHEHNRGLAAARNTAFRAARCELVGSLDADCIAAPDWLANLALHMSDHDGADRGSGTDVHRSFTMTAQQYSSA